MSVLATFTLVTGTGEEAVEGAEIVGTVKGVETAEVDKGDEENKSEYPNLARVPCIQYPITFRKKSVPVSALFHSNSEVNAIYPTLARDLGLPIRPTDVGSQKIDGIMLDTFGMVVTAFSVTGRANWVKFFE